MKTIILSLVLVFGLAGTSNAALWDRGGGLIYDDVLDITWLQDANYAATSGYWDTLTSGTGTERGQMYWSLAMEWVDQLEYYDSVRDITWTNWRLPDAYNQDGSGPDEGYNITTSEMGYMYYVNLGNLGRYAPDGTEAPPGYGLISTGPFDNLLPLVYWTSTEYGPADPYHSWVFFLDYYAGHQRRDSQYHVYLAWPVMDGDVAAIPIPSAIYLFGSGLIGLLGFRKKFRKEA